MPSIKSAMGAAPGTAAVTHLSWRPRPNINPEYATKAANPMYSRFPSRNLRHCFPVPDGWPAGKKAVGVSHGHVRAPKHTALPELDEDGDVVEDTHEINWRDGELLGLNWIRQHPKVAKPRSRSSFPTALSPREGTFQSPSTSRPVSRLDQRSTTSSWQEEPSGVWSYPTEEGPPTPMTKPSSCRQRYAKQTRASQLGVSLQSMVDFGGVEQIPATPSFIPGQAPGPFIPPSCARAHRPATTDGSVNKPAVIIRPEDAIRPPSSLAAYFTSGAPIASQSVPSSPRRGTTPAPPDARPNPMPSLNMPFESPPPTPSAKTRKLYNAKPFKEPKWAVTSSSSDPYTTSSSLSLNASPRASTAVSIRGKKREDAGLDSEGKVITDSKNLVDLRGGELKGGISAVLGGTTMDFTEELDDGVVTKEELASKLRGALDENQARVLDLFREWDSDESGTISKKEFRQALPLLGLNCSKQAAETLFDELDTDASGVFEYAELHKQLRQRIATNRPMRNSDAHAGVGGYRFGLTSSAGSNSLYLENSLAAMRLYETADRQRARWTAARGIKPIATDPYLRG